MGNPKKINSILKASFLCGFLFAFIILPIGCNKTSSPENANIEPQKNLEHPEIAETREVVKPQETIESQEIVKPQEAIEPEETSQANEIAAESEKIEIALLERYDDWDIQFSIGNEGPMGPVDIKVYIDDKLMVNQEFAFDVQRMTPFYFKLSKGEHELRVESVKGNASYKQVINVTGMVKSTYEITGRQWADIIYTVNPMFRGSGGNLRGQFFFRMMDERPVRSG